MTTDEALVTIERDGAVATIRLNRPPMNALNHALRDALVQACTEVSSDSAVKAVVITGGDKVFAAGADIKELAATSVAEMADSIPELQSGLGVVATIPKPTVAAIEGLAFGGGLEVALAADWRVVSEAARLGLPEVSLGLIPGGGGIPRLVRQVGHSRARELVMTGRPVLSEEALRIGLVEQVVPAGTTYQAALAWARNFERSAPRAVEAAKAVVAGLGDADLEAGLALERELFTGVFGTEDAKAGIGSFLASGPGKAVFHGR
jgi:enoyl-CoA hydratase/carnithine racemase